MIEKLIDIFNREGTITSCTFMSIVSEMGSLSEPVRISCSSLYLQIQEIYSNKLVADGFSKETANSIALMMNASIEGGIMLCLTEKASEPLKIISELLPNLLNKF
nr:hypothetical protein [Neobacillus cucumis]